MQKNGKPPSLKDLDERLKAAQSRRAEQTKAPQGRGDASGMAVGFRIVVDLIAGVVVGILIGYWLDRWLDTKPWMLVVFLFLGCAAGLMNVIRTARQLEHQAARDKLKSETGSDDSSPE